jgi:hypothetical protein
MRNQLLLAQKQVPDRNQGFREILTYSKKEKKYGWFIAFTQTKNDQHDVPRPHGHAGPERECRNLASF